MILPERELRKSEGVIMAERTFRATYNETKKAQAKLTRLLDQLIEEERPIKDYEEQTKFIDLLCDATRGLGAENQLRVKSRISSGMLRVQNLEEFTRWVTYQRESQVKLPEKFSTRGNPVVSIVDVWKAIRTELFGVFPKALTLSLEVSPERFERRYAGKKEF